MGTLTADEAEAGLSKEQVRQRLAARHKARRKRRQVK